MSTSSIALLIAQGPRSVLRFRTRRSEALARYVQHRQGPAFRSGALVVHVVDLGKSPTSTESRNLNSNSCSSGHNCDFDGTKSHRVSQTYQTRGRGGLSIHMMSKIPPRDLIPACFHQRVYVATVNPADPPILLKHRFSKKYRHAALDASITRLRVGAEARAILRCLRSGINVPGIRLVDVKEGLLGLELIDGKSVRQIVPGATDDEDYEDEQEGEEYPEPVAPMEEFGVSIG